MTKHTTIAPLQTSMPPWASFDTNHAENRNLQSGDLTKVTVRNTGIVFSDYYWTDADYRQVFAHSGFEVVKKLHPLADGTEPFSWISETSNSYWSIYVLERSIK